MRDAGAQPLPEASGYPHFAESQMQTEHDPIDRELAPAIMDDGFGIVGMAAAVPFGQVPELGRRQGGEQGAFPALRVGVPTPWCSPCPFLRVTKITVILY